MSLLKYGFTIEPRSPPKTESSTKSNLESESGSGQNTKVLQSVRSRRSRESDESEKSDASSSSSEKSETVESAMGETFPPKPKPSKSSKKKKIVLALPPKKRKKLPFKLPGPLSDESKLSVLSRQYYTILTDASWRDAIGAEFSKSYMESIFKFVDQQRKIKNVYPLHDDVFAAFNLTPLTNVRVVILGQDPYIRPNQAHGLSFSVKPPVPPPPSLKNIFKELANDVGFTIPSHGDLTKWAQQGVLLLNTVLTTDEGASDSHKAAGWEKFTDVVISTINISCPNVVFILWGSKAQKKKKLLDTKRHKIVESVHPSPLSAHRGFLGSRPFSATNTHLKSIGSTAINWNLD